MNLASLFHLAGPDLIMILLIVLLLFGAKRLPDLAREEKVNPVAIINRLLVPVAIAIFLMACGVWFFGNSH